MALILTSRQCYCAMVNEKKHEKTHSELVLTGWRGGGWGLRVESQYRRFFQDNRERLLREPLIVDLPGLSAPFPVTLSSSFWRKCPEVRSAVIGRWMYSRGEAPWEKGRPPKYRASLTVGKEIVLRLET